MQHIFSVFVFSIISFPIFGFEINNNSILKNDKDILTNRSVILKPIIDGMDTNGFMKSVEMLLNDWDGTLSKDAQFDECLNDTRLYLDSIRNGHPWALTMLDATGKIPSGILRGNQFEPGNYYECLSMDQSLPDVDRKMAAKYCPMTLKLPEVSLNNSNSQGVIRSQLHDLFGLLKKTQMPIGVTVGFCIPWRCSENQWSKILSKALKIDVKVYSKCRTVNDKPWTRIDIVAAILLPLLGGLIALGTLIDILFRAKEKSLTHQLLVQFSVIANSRRLFSLPNSSQPLDSFHALRSISMFWIIMRHQHKFVTFGSSAVNFLDDLNWSTDMRSAWVYSMPFPVDTFFFLSGFLVTWTSLKKYSKAGWREFVNNLPSFYIKRYVRMVFPMGVFIVITMGPLFHVFDGPLWFGKPANDLRMCDKTCWTNFALINNFMTWGTMNFPHTWYLAADFQMYITASLLLLAVLKYKKFGKICLPTLAVIATVSFIIICHVNRLTVDPPFLGPGEYYSKPWTHASVYLIGMTLAYALFHSEIKIFKLQKSVLLCGWFACFAIMITLVTTMTMLFQTVKYSEWHAVHMSLSRPAWTLCLAWITVCCYYNIAGPIGFILNLKFWTILSRLSFGVYLAHCMVIYFCVLSNPGTNYITANRVVQQYLSTVCLSIIFAIILTLTSETPIMGIMQIIFSKKGNATVRAVKPQTIQKNHHENIEISKC